MDLNILFRRPIWWGLVTVLTLITVTTFWLLASNRHSDTADASQESGDSVEIGARGTNVPQPKMAHMPPPAPAHDGHHLQHLPAAGDGLVSAHLRDPRDAVARFAELSDVGFLS